MRSVLDENREIDYAGDQYQVPGTDTHGSGEGETTPPPPPPPPDAPPPTAPPTRTYQDILKSIDPTNWQAGLKANDAALRALGVIPQIASDGTYRGRVSINGQNYDPFNDYGWVVPRSTDQAAYVPPSFSATASPLSSTFTPAPVVTPAAVPLATVAPTTPPAVVETPQVVSAAAPPVTATTSPYQDQIRALLTEQLTGLQKPVTAEDPAIKSQMAAQEATLERVRQQRRSAMAERYAMEGLNSGGAGSGAFDQDITAGYEDKGNALTSLQAQLFTREVEQRRAQLTQLLGLATSSGDAEAAREIQAQIANTDALLRQAALTQQGGQFNASLGQQSAQFNASLGQNNNQFLQDLALREAQLSQQGGQFNATLEQQAKQWNDQYGLNLTAAQWDQQLAAARAKAGLPF